MTFSAPLALRIYDDAARRVGRIHGWSGVGAWIGFTPDGHPNEAHNGRRHRFTGTELQ
ncbi:hypothetical protein [Nitrosococcus oceani]|uniref:hypothetical protein n=1 Tax=Nitrosococcus oceani TaxID=1229 RepID=UPI0002D4079D|nr:hypothetical protein [Nitrosococcus oceani]